MSQYRTDKTDNRNFEKIPDPKKEALRLAFIISEKEEQRATTQKIASESRKKATALAWEIKELIGKQKKFLDKIRK